MRLDMRRVTGMLLVAGTVLALSSPSTTGTNNAFADETIKRAIPQDRAQERTADRAEKDERRPALVMRMLKEVQRRSCQTRQKTGPPPSSSWPARGQSAITICS
jgi:hypothetical protein